MADEVLEREAALAALESAMAAAEAGHGSLALVPGGPGSGKTSLVRAFAARTAGRARVLRCACDDLVTPRTLGPLHDAAAGTRGPLAVTLADDGPIDAVFPAVLEELEEFSPTVLIVEHAHWADDATLDVLGYAARRVASRPALLVLTLRDDAIDAEHPLQRLLGTLDGEPLHRLALS